MPTIRKEFQSRGSFSRTRLTVARQVSGLTKKSLADMVGVTGGSITNYELGTSEPLESVVESMAKVLNFSTDFFYGKELDLVEPDSLTFRSKRSMTSRLREKAAGQATVAFGLLSPTIRSKFRLPPVDVPNLSDYTPEEAAEILRAHWNKGLGPIDNMVHTLEEKGIEVYWIDEESPSVFAFSRWVDAKPFVFLNSRNPNGDRARYDAAHELAHLVLHCNVDPENLDSRAVESEADRFAACFLLPASQFKSESPRFPQLESYYPLKKRWKVSIAAMVRRSKDLGVISPWQYERACKEISVRKMRLHEPIPIKREESFTHDYILTKLSDKGIAPYDFAAYVGISLAQLEVLMPTVARFHDKINYGDDPYSLSLLRTIDESAKSDNLGLGL